MIDIRVYADGARSDDFREMPELARHFGYGFALVSMAGSSFGCT